jgi:hypothetical protein
MEAAYSLEGSEQNHKKRDVVNQFNMPSLKFASHVTPLEKRFDPEMDPVFARLVLFRVFQATAPSTTYSV